MKKSAYSLAVCMVIAFAAIPARSQAPTEAVIQPETRARLLLQSNLSSRLNEVGDTFTASLEGPIFVNGQIVMPEGTLFHGRVTAVSPAGRPQKGANMTVVFDSVSMPWGEEPVAVMLTAIDDWNKDEKLKANDEGKVSGGHSGDSTLRNVERGGRLGALGANAAILIGAGAGAGRGVLTAGGAGIAGGMLGGVLMTKGGDVHVGSGTTLRIKFVRPMTLPVAQPRMTRPQTQQNDDDQQTQAPKFNRKN